MQKENQGQTAPLKKRKHGWRHLLRERTWAALNIIVGVSMLANTSSLAFLAPKVAEAASIGTYDQCSNDDGDGYTTGDQGCRWINGNLNVNNSLYHEGDSTVQRLWLDGFVPGSSHTVTLQYGTTKGGKHAYDFLTTWDHSENWITEADLCQDIDGCATADASENTLAIPHDANGSGQFESGTRNFVMRGGDLDSASNPSLSGAYTGDSETEITIGFTVANSGDMCVTKQNTTTCGVALFFGAHVAKTDDWFPYNGTSGATAISGSPYHVAMAAIDGDSSGKRDNQMSADAIFQGNVIIEKQTVPDGSSQSFTFNSQTAALAGSLTDGGQIVAALNQGAYSVTEAATTGWTLTSIVCDDTDSTGNIQTGVLSLNVAASETVKCVFTNSQNPKLTVTKVVNNNDGGDAVVADFDLFVNQTQVTSGQTNTKTPGNYVVSENNLPGYTGVISGDCDAQGNVTLAYGDNKSCTITNSDIAPTLKLVKNLTTNSGGSSTLADWTLSATGTNGFSYTADQSSFETVKANEAYALNESGPNGYQAGSWSCDGGTLVGNEVTLALDTDVTCEISNDDIAPTLRLVKNVSGGTNVADDWTMEALDANQAGFTDSGDSITFHEVKANTAYTLNEYGPTGYTAGSWSCDGGTLVGNEVTLALDEDVTCEITNERDRGTVELQKEWSGIPGSTTLTITDSQQQVVDMQAVLGANDSTGKTPVDTGTFYMSETGGLSDYTASNLVCYDDANGNSQNDNENAISVGANDSVNVGKDQNVVCSYTNTRNTGTVTIYKVVRGGTADSSDWTFTLHGQNGLPDVTGIKHGVPVTGVPTGFYTVSESGPAQYSFVGAYGDCSEDGLIYMDVDQDGSTCTFVNETYGIHGQKFNDLNANATWDAGEVALNGWTMFLDANLNKSLDSGEKSIVTQNHNSVDGWYWFDDLAAGSYQICEVQQAGWAQTYPVTASGCHTIELPISYEFNREGPPIIKNSSCKLSLDQSFSVMAVENSIVSEASCDFGNRLIPVTTIALDKTGPATATPGQTFTYTLEWKVNGNTAATNAVITDPLPANTTFVSQTCGTTTPTCTPSFTGNTAKWELGTRAVGTSGTVTVTVLVNPSLTASTTLNNTGTFDTDQTPPVNDSVPTTVTVPQVLGISTELGLTKSVSTPTAAPGDLVTYTLVVTNEGLGDATNVVVTDNLPDGFVFLATNKATRTWNLGTLAAGESKTLTYKVLVTPNVVAGPYVNRAFVTADFFDPLAAEALVTVKIPQVLGLATTGAGLMDYVTFVLGLALVASGVISFLKLRRRGTRTA